MSRVEILKIYYKSLIKPNKTTIATKTDPQEECRGYLNLDKRKGYLTAVKNLSPLLHLTCEYDLKVTDKGLPPLQTTLRLLLQVNDSIPHVPKPNPSLSLFGFSESSKARLSWIGLMAAICSGLVLVCLFVVVVSVLATVVKRRKKFQQRGMFIQECSSGVKKNKLERVVRHKRRPWSEKLRGAHKPPKISSSETGDELFWNGAGEKSLTGSLDDLKFTLDLQVAVRR